MTALVALHNGKEPRVSTFDIFAKFGYKEHRALKKIIFKNRELFEDRGKLLTASTVAANRKRGGQDQSYLLNERQFNLLILLSKNHPESVEFKSRLENEFHRLQKTVSRMVENSKSENWQDARSTGKSIYHQRTDVIKEFIDYAIAQGSKSANMYYTNFANMENSALFFLEQKYPNLRDLLSIRQLMIVATADQVVEKAIQEGMEQKMPYKDIYVLAKERVIAFSEIVGKSLVPLSLQGNHRKQLISQQNH